MLEYGLLDGGLRQSGLGTLHCRVQNNCFCRTYHFCHEVLQKFVITYPPQCSKLDQEITAE
jgi:hypothetical protein